MIGYGASLKKLTKHLVHNEQIIASCGGLWERGGQGLGAALVCTDRRVVVFASKFFGFEMESIEFGRITSIEQSGAVTGPGIGINAAGVSVQMKWCNKGDVPGTVAAIRERIADAQAPRV